MKLQSRARELAACREACRDAKVGDPMWLLHHGRLLEWLTEPVEARIAYILSSKPKSEQARRLHELRPVKGVLPVQLVKAWAAYDTAWAAYDTARAASATARAAYVEAWAASATARAAYVEAWAAYAPEITALHLAECPDTAWNGRRSIF